MKWERFRNQERQLPAKVPHKFRQWQTLATLSHNVNANVNSYPPFFDFLGNTLKITFLANAPEGSSGFANKSWWMTGQDFQCFMRHFIKHTTKETPVLLLMDNHESYIDSPTLVMAKSSGVIFLSYPQYTSHKDQPQTGLCFRQNNNHIWHLSVMK